MGKQIPPARITVPTTSFRHVQYNIMVGDRFQQYRSYFLLHGMNRMTANIICSVYFVYSLLFWRGRYRCATMGLLHKTGRQPVLVPMYSPPCTIFDAGAQVIGISWNGDPHKQEAPRRYRSQLKHLLATRRLSHVPTRRWSRIMRDAACRGP